MCSRCGVGVILLNLLDHCYLNGCITATGTLYLLLHHHLYSAPKSISTSCQCTLWWAIKSLVVWWLLNRSWCIFTRIFNRPRANHTLNYRSISLVVVELLASQAPLYLVKYFSTSGNPVFTNKATRTAYPITYYRVLPPILKCQYLYGNKTFSLVTLPKAFIAFYKSHTAFPHKNGLYLLN